MRCVPGVEWTEEESHSLHGGQEAEAEREEGGENLVPSFKDDLISSHKNIRFYTLSSKSTTGWH